MESKGKTTFIYLLIDPVLGLVRYVGKSDNPKRRYNAHCKCLHKSYTSSWIKSLQEQGLTPVLEVIDEVPVEEWEFWEQHYISLYRSWGFKLTNLTAGGSGFAAGRLNPANNAESIKRRTKTRRANDGYKLSSDAIERMRKALTGRKCPEHSKRMKGRTRSEEAKRKTSQTMQFKNTTLTIIKVKEIKTLFHIKTIKELAELYKVSRWVIRNIKNGKQWNTI